MATTLILPTIYNNGTSQDVNRMISNEVIINNAVANGETVIYVDEEKAEYVVLSAHIITETGRAGLLLRTTTPAAANEAKPLAFTLQEATSLNNVFHCDEIRIIGQ